MIYLAGSCSTEQRTLMKSIAKNLRENGYVVYAPFELQIPDAWDYSQEDWAKMVFDIDGEALNKADIFLMITPGRVGTAETNWEQGYAYAKQKKVIVVQYTEADTSLMTYVGSTTFVNSSLDNLMDDIHKALNIDCNKVSCKTVLT